MLSLDDKRWQNLAGGYRTEFDPRPLLSKLEAGDDPETTWHALWDELQHQGDVGEASYAAVPHIVRAYRQRRVNGWNTYAIVAVIELARGNGKNPEVPDWLKEDYHQAIRELAEIGATEVFRANDPDEVRAILSILALVVGAPTHARFFLEYSEQELLEIDRLASKRNA